MKTLLSCKSCFENVEHLNPFNQLFSSNFVRSKMIVQTGLANEVRSYKYALKGKKIQRSCYDSDGLQNLNPINQPLRKNGIPMISSWIVPPQST